MAGGQLSLWSSKSIVLLKSQYSGLLHLKTVICSAQKWSMGTYDPATADAAATATAAVAAVSLPAEVI